MAISKLKFALQALRSERGEPRAAETGACDDPAAAKSHEPDWPNLFETPCRMTDAVGKDILGVIDGAAIEANHVQVRVRNPASGAVERRSPDSVQLFPRGQPARLDLSAQPEVRESFAKYLGQFGEQYLPRLTLTNWQAVAPADRNYYCIPYSVGLTTTTEFPGMRVADFDEFYRGHGFTELKSGEFRDKDFALLDGLEKVILFGFPPDHPRYPALREFWSSRQLDEGPIPMHAARQDANGLWPNKMGPYEVISTEDPRLVGDGEYGVPIKMYMRQRTPPE